jgi:hypothetical protein
MEKGDQFVFVANINDYDIILKLNINDQQFHEPYNRINHFSLNS